jgi:hypothetical protein
MLIKGSFPPPSALSLSFSFFHRFYFPLFLITLTFFSFFYMPDPIVIIQHKEPSSNSSTTTTASDDPASTPSSSSDSSYSSQSNFSDKIKNYNKVKRQGSQSSLMVTRHQKNSRHGKAREQGSEPSSSFMISFLTLL